MQEAIKHIGMNVNVNGTMVATRRCLLCHVIHKAKFGLGQNFFTEISQTPKIFAPFLTGKQWIMQFNIMSHHP